MTENDFDRLLQIYKFLKMQLIKIKVKSVDNENISRIKNTVMDYNKYYEGVIGDNVKYLSSYTEDVYHQIKERIPVFYQMIILTI